MEKHYVMGYDAKLLLSLDHSRLAITHPWHNKVRSISLSGCTYLLNLKIRDEVFLKALIYLAHGRFNHG